MNVDQFISRLVTVVVNPLIQLLFAAALVYFLWGVFVYLRDSDNDASRTTGRQHIIWGLVGMAIMAGVFGIMEISLRTVLGS